MHRYRMKVGLGICLLCCLYLRATGQQFKPLKGIGLNGAAGFSYTGINTFLTPAVYLGRHCIYGGPQFSLSRSYFFSRGIWGINAGYRYTVLVARRWSALVLADFQSFCTVPYNPHRLPVNSRNLIRELQAGLGLYYHPVPSWHIGLELGAGVVQERFEDLSEQKTRYSSGMTQMLRLSTGILIWKK